MELCELLGDTTNVSANTGDINMILKVNPHKAPAMGSDFKFYVSHKAAYVFDAETEQIVENDVERR